MEQGPVLIVTFVAQQIIYVEDTSGKVIEGDKVKYLLSSDLKMIIIKISFKNKDKIKRVNHVWVLFRDQTLLDPNTAWRLMECASHQSEQFV